MHVDEHIGLVEALVVLTISNETNDNACLGTNHIVSPSRHVSSV
jgi:hypothetical protein